MKRGESFAIDSYVHVYNRGAKKMPIYRQKSDLWRLLFNLFYLNTVTSIPQNWKRELERGSGPAAFVWPDHWGEREPLVAILAFSIMPNHFHLILKELVENGISKFMHRVCMGYSKYINAKHNESGSLFQGAFKARIVADDMDFRYLAAYVMVKNPFELYPGGLRRAIEEFDSAYEFACESPFNSLAEYAGKRSLPIVNKDLLGELYQDPDEFKEFARECMLYKLEQIEAIASFAGETPGVSPVAGLENIISLQE